MMDQDQLPLHGRRRQWKRSRPSSPSANAECVKNKYACVRFTYGYPESVKWLRLKIPGILIQKIEASCCPQTESKRLRSTSSPGISTSENDDLSTHYHQPGMEVYPSTHHLKLRNCLNKMVLQRYVTCKLDPVLDGPFTFPFPHGLYTSLASHASIGSVVFALAGYDEHFDPKARSEVYAVICGCHPTIVGSSYPRKFVTGSPICGGKRLNSSPPKHPPNYASDNTCYHLQYCDFSKPNPEWQMSPHPFVSPRILPTLISLQGMLFAFGGNCPSDVDSPFAEAFDPGVGYWEPLPTPPFGRLGLYELYVFPLPTSGRILVVGAESGILYTFDVSTWCWHPFKTNCFDREFSILDSLQALARCCPVLSVFDEAICWVDRYGRLCVYDVVDDGKYYSGPIKGLHLEDAGYLLVDKSNSLALLPLSKHLMGLLWLSGEMDDSGNPTSSLHITMLHVSVESVPSEMDIENECDDNYYAFFGMPLTVTSVACLSFPIEGTDLTEVIDACLMDEGGSNIF